MVLVLARFKMLIKGAVHTFGPIIVKFEPLIFGSIYNRDDVAFKALQVDGHRALRGIVFTSNRNTSCSSS